MVTDAVTDALTKAQKYIDPQLLWSQRDVTSAPASMVEVALAWAFGVQPFPGAFQAPDRSLAIAAAAPDEPAGLGFSLGKNGRSGHL